MATAPLKTIYTGESDVITIQHKDSAGVAIPFASINDVRYIIKDQSGTTLLKFKENAPIGWEAATPTANPGEYTLKVLESDTKSWLSGKVYIEWFINVDDTILTDGYKTMSQVYLYSVIKSNYSEQ
tara:strand:+ start:388 stop:765 length:378 start_codon:yes stop_codon:yes gene_type:complete